MNLLKTRIQLVKQGKLDLAFKYEAAIQKATNNKLLALQLAASEEDQDMTNRRMAVERRYRNASYQGIANYFNAWYSKEPGALRTFAIGYQASMNLAGANEQALKYYVGIQWPEWDIEKQRLEALAGPAGIAGIDFPFDMDTKVFIEALMNAATPDQQRQCFEILTMWQRLSNSDIVPGFVHRQLEYVLREYGLGS